MKEKYYKIFELNILNALSLCFSCNPPFSILYVKYIVFTTCFSKPYFLYSNNGKSSSNIKKFEQELFCNQVAISNGRFIFDYWCNVVYFHIIF